MFEIIQTLQRFLTYFTVSSWYLKRVHPGLSQKVFFPREKNFFDTNVYGVEMSQVYQKPILFDQKRFFRYFRAPKPPQANPKIPIPY